MNFGYWLLAVGYQSMLMLTESPTGRLTIFVQ
jgi:hypothetical protein